MGSDTATWSDICPVISTTTQKKSEQRRKERVGDEIIQNIPDFEIQRNIFIINNFFILINSISYHIEKQLSVGLVVFLQVS